MFFVCRFYGGCAWGTLVCAEFQCSRSVNPRTAATYLFDSGLWELHQHWELVMLKIVPDPPHHSSHSLEDILVQASEYLLCALTIAQQAMQLHSKPPEQALTLATLHEIENAHALVEVALSKVQLQH